jgi:hypothetical protein
VSSPNITVLAPTAKPPAVTGALSARWSSIDPRTIALVSNSKPNVEVFFNTLDEELKTRFAGLTLRRYAKVTSGVPAEPALLDEVAAACGAAVVGVGD